MAHFVGDTKLSWPSLKVDSLARKANEVLGFRRRRTAQVPQLSAFHNAEIFNEEVVQDLVSVRDRIREVSRGANRKFLLLGLVAIIEDVSHASKDGPGSV